MALASARQREVNKYITTSSGNDCMRSECRILNNTTGSSRQTNNLQIRPKKDETLYRQRLFACCLFGYSGEGAGSWPQAATQRPTLFTIDNDQTQSTLICEQFSGQRLTSRCWSLGHLYCLHRITETYLAHMATPSNPAPASVLFVCLGNICMQPCLHKTNRP